MLSKKVSKLFPYSVVRNRQYCCIKGEDVVQCWTLPQATTELGDMKSFSILSEIDVFSSSKLEDLGFPSKCPLPLFFTLMYR